MLLHKFFHNILYSKPNKNLTAKPLLATPTPASCPDLTLALNRLACRLGQYGAITTAIATALALALLLANESWQSC